MKKSKLQLASWALFVLVVAGVILYTAIGGSSDPVPASSASTPEAEPQRVHILKYSDYQCPACKLYIPLQEELKREFGDLVTIEYRHFPLSGHPYAELAARSVEAAAEQGRRTEMHDRIFEGQEIWSAGGAREIFFGYADRIGLDMDRFESDLESDDVRNRVRSQRAEGERRQVRATPTFFLNGRRLQQNPQSYAQFRSIVEMHMYRTAGS